MKKISRVVAVCCLLALCGGCAAGPSEMVPEHIFRYAENQAGDFPTTLAAYYFAEQVAERSGGRIRIYVYPDAQLGDERSIIEQMQYGGIDFGRVNLSPLSEYDPRLFVLQLPYLYDDRAHMWRVLESEIGDVFLEGLSEIGIVGLAWVDAGARSFYTRTKPVHTLEDMQGLRIRVQENTMMERLVELLGASPVQMRYDEVLPGLQTGKIDGAENNYPSYQSTGHSLLAPYFFEDEHSRIPELIVASEAAMARLDDADRALVLQAAQDASVYQRELFREYETRTREEVIAAGCEVHTITAEERQALIALTAPMAEEFAQGAEDILRAIAALGEEAM